MDNVIIKNSLLILMFSAFSFEAYPVFFPSNKGYQNFNLQPSINCLRLNTINVFSGLSNSERLQKLYDGTIEKELIKTYDKNKNDLFITSSQYKQNKKNQTNPFLGLSNSERLQKLYDGTIEKELIKAYDKNKNDLNITPSLFNTNIKDGCLKTKNINFLKGLSNSERLQKIYDGSLEREYIRLNP
jgi:hypothetical protein